MLGVVHRLVDVDVHRLADPLRVIEQLSRGDQAGRATRRRRRRRDGERNTKP
jgi:hypothetical protein